MNCSLSKNSISIFSPAKLAPFCEERVNERCLSFIFTEESLRKGEFGEGKVTLGKGEGKKRKRRQAKGLFCLGSASFALPIVILSEEGQFLVLLLVVLHVEGQFSTPIFVLLSGEGQILVLILVVLPVEGQFSTLIFVLLSGERQILVLLLVVLYVEGQFLGLRFVLLTTIGQIEGLHGEERGFCYSLCWAAVHGREWVEVGFYV